jgi:hypothetical protein
MAGDKGTHTAEQENEPDKRPPWWKRLWARTGFGDKTLWDLLQLLIVPLALAGIGFWFSTQQDARQQAVEEQRAQDEALQAYLDQMSSLMIGKNSLRESEEGSEVRTLARARTLTVLGRLDPKRKTALMQFLVEAGLVQRVEGGRGPIISLTGANLSDANLRVADLSGAYLYDANLSNANLFSADLSGAYLSEADLSNADPSNADLSNANLSDADLSGAWLYDTDLSNADLIGADLSNAELFGANLSEAYLRLAHGVTKEELEQQAESLEGTIMPDGTIYPGRYAAREFEPALSFSVSDGWRFHRSLVETTDLLPIEGPERGQLFFISPRHVYDPSNPSELKEVPAPGNADEWASWFQSHPNLDTSKPPGTSGKQIDVTVTSTPENYPQEVCGVEPCVPLYPTSAGVITSSEGWKHRYVIVDVGGETVIIDVAAPADKFDEFLPKAQKVFDTVEWQGG